MTSCFVYKFIRDLESINHLCINPILRIGLIHKCFFDLHELKLSVQVNVLFNNCKQTRRHCLSWLARQQSIPRLFRYCKLYWNVYASCSGTHHFQTINFERQTDTSF